MNVLVVEDDPFIHDAATTEPEKASRRSDKERSSSASARQNYRYGSRRTIEIQLQLRADSTVLAIDQEMTYIVFIGFWPDNRVVSLLVFPGARSDFLTITSTNRVKAAIQRAFAHVHLHQSRKVSP